MATNGYHDRAIMEANGSTTSHNLESAMVSGRDSTDVGNVPQQHSITNGYESHPTTNGGGGDHFHTAEDLYQAELDPGLRPLDADEITIRGSRPSAESRSMSVDTTVSSVRSTAHLLKSPTTANGRGPTADDPLLSAVPGDTLTVKARHRLCEMLKVELYGKYTDLERLILDQQFDKAAEVAKAQHRIQAKLKRSPDRSLHLASLFGDAELVESLIDAGYGVESEKKVSILLSYIGVAPLFCALGMRHQPTIRVLLAKGAGVSKPFQNPCAGLISNALLRLAPPRDEEEFCTLLAVVMENGFKINTVIRTRESLGTSFIEGNLLSLAIQDMIPLREMVARVLVEKGASVMRASPDSEWALRAAVYTDAVDVVPFLLDRDDRCEQLKEKRRHVSALLLAIMRTSKEKTLDPFRGGPRSGSLAMVRAILEGGGNPHAHSDERTLVLRRYSPICTYVTDHDYPQQIRELVRWYSRLPSGGWACDVDALSVTQLRALYSFVPDTEDELEFRKGDVIQVKSRDYPKWWKGELNGKAGWVPLTYVEMLPTSGAHL